MNQMNRSSNWLRWIGAKSFWPPLFAYLQEGVSKKHYQNIMNEDFLFGVFCILVSFWLCLNLLYYGFSTLIEIMASLFGFSSKPIFSGWGAFYWDMS